MAGLVPGAGHDPEVNGAAILMHMGPSLGMTRWQQPCRMSRYYNVNGTFAHPDAGASSAAVLAHMGQPPATGCLSHA